MNSSLIPVLTALLAVTVHAASPILDPEVVAPPTLTVSLSDGSQLKGTTTLKELSLRSEALGKLTVPLTHIAAVKFSIDRETVTVTLHNGDKIQAGLGDTKLVLTTIFGPVTVPLDKTTDIQLRRDGVTRGIEWDPLPYPTAHDWPGPRGKRAIVGTDAVVIQGQPVRSQETFRGPVTVACEVTAEYLHMESADLMIEFVPTGLAKDAVVDKVPGTQRLHFGVGQGNRLTFCAHDGGKWREVWSAKLPAFKADEPHRLELEVRDEQLRVRVDGQVYKVDKTQTLPEEFHIQLWNWQPSSRWRVRNFTVR